MKLKTAALAIAFGMVSASALAQEFYVGVGAGQSKLKSPSVSGTFGGAPFTYNSDKDTDTAWKLFAGYDLTENWGVEVGYNDLGNKFSASGKVLGTKFHQDDIKADNWYIAGTGTLPLSEGFALYAKLGWVHNKVNGGNINGVGAGDETRNSLLAGAGASWTFMPGWTAKVEYEDYGKATSDDAIVNGAGAIKASAWFIDIQYSFKQ